MKNIHSIIIIKNGNKFLNYFDKRWGIYLFPNMEGNDIEEIKKKYNTSNVKFLFDKVHDKYSIPRGEVRKYHHYFYELDIDVEGEYFELDELLSDSKIKQNNSDIINFIKDFYKL